MARRKLQTRDEYRFDPRSVLKPGDRFRVTGGPVYLTAEKKKVPMYERGVFVFRRYCEQGGAKWIEAEKVGGGVALLWVGKPHRSPVIPNLRRKPYRITGKVKNGRLKGVK